jgi:hypothetical protein
MRKCQLQKDAISCKDQGFGCLACEEFVDRTCGIMVDNPPSIHNDNGIKDPVVRHLTIKRLDV